MSEQAIQKLRKKFILYAMLSLSIVMCLIGGMIYVINLVVTRNEIRETMDYIVEHDGVIQDAVYIYDGSGTDVSFENDAADASTGDGASEEEEDGYIADAGNTENGDITNVGDTEEGGIANAGDTEEDITDVGDTDEGNITDAGDTDDTINAGSTESGESRTLDRTGGKIEIAGQSSSQTERILRNLNQTIDENTYDITRFLNEIFGTNRDDAVAADAGSEDSFSTRYFAVVYDANGVIQAIIANHISSLTSEEVEALGTYAVGRLFRFGQYGKYYYQVSDYGDGGTMVVYLDSTNQIQATTRLLYSAMLLIVMGVVITFIFVRMFSTKAIAPEIRNAELQKQFITNASHELKTPLAVIRANTEMQEILTGENEWTQSTLRQVDRLNGLIQNLVTITKAQESETEERIPTDVSKIVNDVVETYVPVSQQDGKKMERNIPDGITMKAVDSEIRQLATLLLDNAIKYCDDKGMIRTSVWQKGRETWISVTNDYAEGKDVDYSKFFERFYRKDEAHTIGGEKKESKGGYGIGLSIAESLVKKYNGTIRADWKDGKITFTCMLK